MRTAGKCLVGAGVISAAVILWSLSRSPAGTPAVGDIISLLVSKQRSHDSIVSAFAGESAVSSAGAGSEDVRHTPVEDEEPTGLPAGSESVEVSRFLQNWADGSPAVRKGGVSGIMDIAAVRPARGEPVGLPSRFLGMPPELAQDRGTAGEVGGKKPGGNDAGGRWPGGGTDRDRSSDGTSRNRSRSPEPEGLPEPAKDGPERRMQVLNLSVGSLSVSLETVEKSAEGQRGLTQTVRAMVELPAGGQKPTWSGRPEKLDEVLGRTVENVVTLVDQLLRDGSGSGGYPK
ncbi:MAG: hypothetical protein QJR06_03410 [Alicyclobacillaceae bacterium]|nr:hypothetical protein [Alicyclobacillaceae bacterium]